MVRLDALMRDPRVTVRRDGAPDPDGKVVTYWMQRAQRADDNPALDVAVHAANALGKPVVAFLGLLPFYPHGNLRHYHFLVEGLPELAQSLRSRGVGFVLRPWPDHSLARFVMEVRAALVVGDENPLRETEGWRRTAADRLRVPLWTVDADVVVPSRLLGKEQFAARTMRPRLHAQLDEFLRPSREPRPRVPFVPPPGLLSVDPRADVLVPFPLDRSVAPVSAFRGGASEAARRLRRFLDERLRGYDHARNHPELQGTTELSPYLHFGQIGPRSIALAVRASEAPEADRDALLEQLIVRRELAINFVKYNPHYDSLAGCERWARATLRTHARDPRPVRYTEAELEAAATADPLWNAAQRQALRTGWMHNYLRMYWAKKILEWTESPEGAFAIAARLDDKYFLDGRDPCGYAGVAWAIGGKHDRPWPERPIFGTVRYMSGASTGRKFDAREYIRQNT